MTPESNKTRWFIAFISTLLGGGALADSRTYQAAYTHSAPTIDGVAAPGEWDAAAVAGSWGILRRPEADVDAENSRFRMMWNETYLFILVQSDKTSWSGARDNTTPFVPGGQVQGISFGADNINFYFDPNLDSEEGIRPDGAVDGYQIAWNQLEGKGSLLPQEGGGSVFMNTGLFLENHINTPFGNNGRWQGLRKSSFVQVHGATGGTIEFALAWADLDAPGRTRFRTDPDKFPADSGTAHPYYPQSGEKWIFNAARISSDGNNFLPVWSWHGAQSFAVAPHGIIEFTGGPRSYEAAYTAVAPEIDGEVVPGEWDDVPVADNWGILRRPEVDVDAEKNRFRMKWDSKYLYILIQTDKSSWNPAVGNETPFVPGSQVQGISFNSDNINIYLDPNTDGELRRRPDGKVDGYQIAWNEYEGTGSLDDDGAGGRVFKNTGLFLENHINTPFGNQGRWQGLRATKFVQKHGATGGVVEMALAWADIDAPGLPQFEANPEQFPSDTGTFHPYPPSEGEEWIFNISRISSDGNNFLPVWSWQGAQSFAVAPHGTLRFTGGPRTYQAQYVTVPPVMNGVVSPGEWSLAAPGGDNWHILRRPAVDQDAENTRFKVLWDSSYIYFLVQSDKIAWSGASGNSSAFVPGSQIQGISFNSDNLNIYIDPNVDAEYNSFRPDNEVDGYQIAWNQLEGEGSLIVDQGVQTFKNTGLFLENHINTPFGNNGIWQGLRTSTFVQNHDATGGVIEFALAWADLDSPGSEQFPGGLPADAGTAHTKPALNGERFIFNVSRISSDGANFLPIWSWHKGQSFAVAPHGFLQFEGAPETPTITKAILAPEGFSITFTSLDGLKYSLEFSPDLAVWEPVVNDISGTGEPIVVQDTDVAHQLLKRVYYRIRVQ